jgi:hypothetical protein
VVPEFVTAEDLSGIGELVKGARIHAFQQFVPRSTLDKKFEVLKPYSAETIAKFADAMRAYAEKTLLRV